MGKGGEGKDGEGRDRPAHFLVAFASYDQRRRNCGGDGGARPRNVEITGARVSFRSRNIFPHFCMLFLKLPVGMYVLLICFVVFYL